MMEEKYQHCIFVCSNYTARTRNGLHFLYNETNVDEVMNIVNRYVTKEGVSFYFIVTNNSSIESVKNKDHFFKSIDILEGTNPDNVIVFNNSINNQISATDVALLLLSIQKMNCVDLKTYLFYIYCLYAKKNDSFPFKDKCYFDNKIIGFKAINNEFGARDSNILLECTKPNVVMSKFFNTDKGVELMNKVLELYNEIKKQNIHQLSERIIEYFNKCKKKYKKSSENSRYPFVLTKKSINALNIDII